MFTVCPKCTLTLVVTTVDLRAGQGYVRCGRCANVFNALIALREGEPGSTSDTASRRLQETAPKQPADAPMNPAVGAGVADMEPEPEPETGAQAESGADPESSAEPAGDDPGPVASSLAGDEPGADTLIESELDTIAAEGASPEPDGATEEASLEFDPIATDVSEIFISPDDAERGAGSGSFETVVLAEEPPTEIVLEGEPGQELEPEPSAHTDTVAADDWSLLDDEPSADAESVIEESPLSDVAAEDGTGQAEAAQPDPAWVQEMFAEAEAEAERARTAEHPVFLDEPPVDEQPHDQAPADSALEPVEVETPRPAPVAAAPLDPELEPLLARPAAARPRWQHMAGIAGLLLLLGLQVIHHHRQGLVLDDTFGPVVSKVYGWFGATPTPRWDLAAYSVKQLGAEAEGGDGNRLRVRLSLQNDSPRVQPLPLLRLTLQDRYGNAVATRDLEPREYLPPRAAGQRLLEPDQRIDAELHVVDPGRAAIGFEIDACLRSDAGGIGCANDARRRTAG